MNLYGVEYWSLVDDQDQGYFSWARCQNTFCTHRGDLGGMRYNCVGIDTTDEGTANLRVGESNRVEAALCTDCMVERCG